MAHAILTEAVRRGWRIGHLWYTHAHFDHIGGAAAIADALNPLPLVALHPADHVLWRSEGGAPFFGFKIDPGPEPTIDLQHGQVLRLGSVEFEVRHTPGHTPGMCILYVASEGSLLLRRPDLPRQRRPHRPARRRLADVVKKHT
jgi:hydroxyacylglutathione hydrolase